MRLVLGKVREVRVLGMVPSPKRSFEEIGCKCCWKKDIGVFVFVSESQQSRNSTRVGMTGLGSHVMNVGEPGGRGQG